MPHGHSFLARGSIRALKSHRNFTSVQGSQHARYKPIYTPTLLDKWYQGRNSTLIVGGMPEVRKNHPLEGLNLIL